MEKTFEELIEESFYDKDRPFMYFYKEDIIPLLQQVREATIAEIENKANEYGEYGTADYVHEMPKDRIKIKQ